ncbi:MAG TPA: exopolysaccharide biosynthesis protein [Chromatiales bacterium]|nr:exopolysaccharide biosynthesis protein [Chromatiales bacterium]
MDRITKAIKRARESRETVMPLDHHPARPKPGKARIEPRKLSVSREKLQENRIILSSANDPAAHAYKVLRTRVWQQMRAHGWSTLGVTSANEGEGKSLTAINLAIGLAKMDVAQSVILVDLDLRRPSLHRYFDFWPEAGITDYLQGGAGLGELLLKPDIGNMILLPGNMPFANSSEIISSSKMGRLLNELKANFQSRLVIFDLPPMLLTDDVMVFSPHLDAVLFVIEEGRSTADEISEAVDMLKDVELLGTVLNKSEDVGHGEGYY